MILSDKDIGIQLSTNNGNSVATTAGSFVTSISASETSKIECHTFDLIIIEEDVGEIKGLKYFKDIQVWSNLDLSTRAIYLHTSTDITHRAQVFAEGVREAELVPAKSLNLFKKAVYILDKNEKVIFKNNLFLTKPN
jgi:hypothetical protein